MDRLGREGGAGDDEEVREVRGGVEEDGGGDERARDVEDAEVREETDGDVEGEVGVVCWLKGLVSGRGEDGRAKGRTFVFGTEPAATDAELDEVRTALEDVREAALGEEGRAPERETLERLRAAEDVE